MASKVYLIASNSTSAIYCTQIVGEGGGYDPAYPIGDANFSIIEIPSYVDPSFYVGTKFLGAPSSLMLNTLDSYSINTFASLIELPPEGPGTANWDGSAWLSVDGNVPTGGLILEPVNVSDAMLSVYEGGNIDINCEFSCSDPNSTISYNWSNGGDLPIPGATSSTLSLTNVSPSLSGDYYCLVSSTCDSDFGAKKIKFTLTVYPAI